MSLSEKYSRERRCFLVSHWMEDILKLCDHAAWLDKGVLKMSGEVQAVTEAYVKGV